MDGIRNSRKVLLKGCNLDMQKVFKNLKIILHTNKSLFLFEVVENENTFASAQVIHVR